VLDPGGSQSLLSAGVLGCCVVNLGGVCGVLHVFGGVVVGGWWCSVEPVPGQSGRAMNLGRGL